MTVEESCVLVYSTIGISMILLTIEIQVRAFDSKYFFSPLLFDSERACEVVKVVSTYQHHNRGTNVGVARWTRASEEMSSLTPRDRAVFFRSSRSLPLQSFSTTFPFLRTTLNTRLNLRCHPNVQPKKAASALPDPRPSWLATL